MGIFATEKKKSQPGGGCVGFDLSIREKDIGHGSLLARPHRRNRTTLMWLRMPEWKIQDNRPLPKQLMPHLLVLEIMVK
jgi:hypothetical protein